MPSRAGWTGGLWLLAIIVLLSFAGVSAVAGAALGRRASAIMERPATFATIFPLLGAGVLVACVTGMIDLYPRLNTP